MAWESTGGPGTLHWCDKSLTWNAHWLFRFHLDGDGRTWQPSLLWEPECLTLISLFNITFKDIWLHFLGIVKSLCFPEIPKRFVINGHRCMGGGLVCGSHRFGISKPGSAGVILELRRQSQEAEAVYFKIMDRRRHNEYNTSPGSKPWNPLHRRFQEFRLK